MLRLKKNYICTKTLLIISRVMHVFHSTQTNTVLLCYWPVSLFTSSSFVLTPQGGSVTLRTSFLSAFGRFKSLAHILNLLHRAISLLIIKRLLINTNFKLYIYRVFCSSFTRSWPYRWLSALGSAGRMHTNMPGSSSSCWLVHSFIHSFIQKTRFVFH